MTTVVLQQFCRILEKTHLGGGVMSVFAFLLAMDFGLSQQSVWQCTFVLITYCGQLSEQVGTIY